jgi:MFS family permease
MFAWFRKLRNSYDNSVLIVMCLAYFLQGFKVFLSLSTKDLFKQYLNLQPDESQFISSIISLPWSFKIIYGIISDNLPICGSRRRVYVMINGGMQSFALLMLVANISSSVYFIATMLFIGQLNQAFLDVVVDALMVAQSKRDQECGSADLQVLAWSLLATGGILGSVLSAFFTEYLTPRHTFLMCATLALVIMIAGYRINP